MTKVVFELLAPMMYIEDMEKAFKVKTMKKLPKLQLAVIDWMRSQVKCDEEFIITDQKIVNNEPFYGIPVQSKFGLGLQFPVRYFRVIET